MANVPELFDIADQIQEDERRASLDQPGSSRPTTGAATLPPQPSLGEEVNEVIGQLGRFWGGFSKQSQTVLQSARKDFRSVVETARKETSWLTSTSNVPSKPSEPENATSRAANNISDESVEPISVDTSKGKEKEIDDDTATIKPNSPTTSSSMTGTFFSRLQANLPPQFAPAAITASLQTQFTTAQAQADALRASLATNIQRIQQEGVAGSGPISLAQAEKLAEEYVHRSEELLKNAGAFLKDAVHVVPGEASGDMRGVVWDGSDIWMMPSPIGTPASTEGGSGTRPTLTHSEMLLRRLKHDPEILRADPSLTPSVSERYEKYLEGFKTENSEWTTRIRDVVAEASEDSDALLATKELLVPSIITEDEFWKRYFFRVLQISEDEEKRKIILEAPTQADDDFSWEDDDTKPTPSEPPQDQSTVSNPSLRSSSSVTTLKTPTNDPTILSVSEPAAADTPTTPVRSASQVLIAHSGVSTSNTSPRESESSFDVVSASSSVAGAAVSGETGVGEKKSVIIERAKDGEKEGSDDSDWE